MKKAFINIVVTLLILKVSIAGANQIECANIFYGLKSTISNPLVLFEQLLKSNDSPLETTASDGKDSLEKPRMTLRVLRDTKEIERTTVYGLSNRLPSYLFSFTVHRKSKYPQHRQIRLSLRRLGDLSFNRSIADPALGVRGIAYSLLYMEKGDLRLLDLENSDRKFIIDRDMMVVLDKEALEQRQLDSLLQGDDLPALKHLISESGEHYLFLHNKVLKFWGPNAVKGKLSVYSLPEALPYEVVSQFKRTWSWRAWYGILPDSAGEAIAIKVVSEVREPGQIGQGVFAVDTVKFPLKEEWAEKVNSLSRGLSIQELRGRPGSLFFALEKGGVGRFDVDEMGFPLELSQFVPEIQAMNIYYNVIGSPVKVIGSLVGHPKKYYIFDFDAKTLEYTKKPLKPFRDLGENPFSFMLSLPTENMKEGFLVMAAQGGRNLEFFDQDGRFCGSIHLDFAISKIHSDADHVILFDQDNQAYALWSGLPR